MRPVIAFAFALQLGTGLACCVPGRDAKPANPESKTVEAEPPKEVAPEAPKELAPKAPDVPAETWVDASKDTATVEFLEVRITGARVGKTRQGGKETPGIEPRLIIYLRAKNHSETKVVSMLVPPLGVGKPPVTVADAFGNRFTGWAADDPWEIDEVKSNGSEKIYPGKEALQVLLCEPPIDKASELRVSFNAPSPIDGVFRFKLPVSMVKR